MRVLAFNSSPNRGKGGTAAILTPFLEGMEQAGANVELVYVHTLNINPCRGCYVCWVKTPGQCIQKDDMQDLLPKMAAADILVLATPVYVDGMTGTMKMLLDRGIPLLKPFFEIRADHCRHPPHEPMKDSKLVLVSVSGFYEMDNFDPLVTHTKAICKNMDREFAGALLRPYAHALSNIKRGGKPTDDIFAAARNAGFDLVKKGKIATSDLATVSRDLIPREILVKNVNAHFQRAIDTYAKK